MKLCKNLTSILILAVAMMLIAGTAADAKTIKIRYAHVGVEGAPQTRYANELEKRIEAVTEGRVQVDVFPNGQLGGKQEMVDGVQLGSIGMAMHDFAALEGIYKPVAVFGAPYAFKSPQHAIDATQHQRSELMQEMNKELVKRGNVRFVGSVFRGARQMSANFPVYSPADMKGKKFRGPANQLWVTMYKGLGAIPTPIEFSELATALMTGVVVGQDNPLTNIYAGKLYEVQTHIMMTYHMTGPVAVFMNNELYESIPEADRKKIDDVFLALADETVQWMAEANKTIVGKLEKEGITFIDESNGLKTKEFRAAVMKQVGKDYPDWGPLLKRIDAAER